jgi:hypothetical protein
MATRGVASYHHVAEIQWVIIRDVPKPINRIADVLESARISASRFAEATIFDVPNSIAVPPEIVGDMVHQFKAGQLRKPASAMD